MRSKEITHDLDLLTLPLCVARVDINHVEPNQLWSLQLA
jgi:hypothetical protein